MKNRTEIGKDEVSIISSGVTIEGKLSSNGNIRIDGVVKGDVTTAGNVALGENGEVNGEIRASTITIGGKVTGTVYAEDKLILEAKSTLKGDLVTKILQIDAGAFFEGTSSMSGTKGIKEKDLFMNENVVA